MISIDQYFIIIYITYVHCQHPFPFVGNFGLKMALTNGLSVRLRRILFDGCPVVGMMEHPVNVIWIQVGPLA
ncbi:hypothetical protein D9M68_961890 [compost metagenome]